ncbi:MAG: hypothetical protein GF315_02015 [candidate division Zixibacteria bacterium]|nr:hypothetical protein [candidate division Zixibacteria bacterium]
MFKSKSVIISSFVFIAVLVGIMLINGCGKVAPVGPDNDQTALKEPFGNEQVEQQWGRVFVMKVDHAVDLVTSPDHPVEIDIGAGGYNAKLDVPNDATDGVVNITAQASAYLTASGMVYVFEFGPDGTQFDKSTTLSLDVEAIEDYDENDKFDGAELRYWNSDKQEWELYEVDADDDGNGKFEFNIDHFSRYGIGGRTT